MHTRDSVHQHADHGLLADVSLGRSFVQNLDFHGVPFAHHDVIRRSVEHHLDCLLRDAFGGQDGTEVIGPDAQQVFVVDQLEPCVIEGVGLSLVHDDGLFLLFAVGLAWQVDGGLALPLETLAVPLMSNLVVVPLLVADGRWQGNNPQRLDNLLFFFDNVFVVIIWFARTSQSLLDGAGPLVLLLTTSCAQHPVVLLIVHYAEAVARAGGGLHILKVLDGHCSDHSHVLFDLRKVQVETAQTELEAALAGHRRHGAFFVRGVDHQAVFLTHEHLEALVLGVDGRGCGGHSSCVEPRSLLEHLLFLVFRRGCRLLHAGNGVQKRFLLGDRWPGDQRRSLDPQPPLLQNRAVDRAATVCHTFRSNGERTINSHEIWSPKSISHDIFHHL